MTDLFPEDTEEGMKGSSEDEEAASPLDSPNMRSVSNLFDILNGGDEEDQSDDHSRDSDPKELKVLLELILDHVGDCLNRKRYNLWTILLSTLLVLVVSVVLMFSFSCVKDYIRDRKLRKRRRDTRNARALYNNLNQIHQEGRNMN